MGTYNKTVINSNTAPAASRIDAIYDYVGAVYGKSGKVKYDGNLTVEERKEVTAEFGELKLKGGKLRKQDIELYMNEARIGYLVRLGLPFNQKGLCNDFSKFRATPFQHPQLGKAYFFGGPHANCGVEIGALYFARGLELDVAAHPENWIFFLEAYGVQSFGGRQMSLDQEGLVFEKIAKTLGIPLYNPLPHHLVGLDVMEAASKRYQRTVEEYISAIISGELINKIRTRRYAVPQWPAMLTELTTGLSKTYQRKPEDLRENFFRYMNNGAVPQGAEEEMRFWLKLGYNGEYIKSLEPKEKELMNQLIAISNEINIPEVQKHLGKNPTRKAALYQGGTAHEDLVRGTYSQKK